MTAPDKIWTAPTDGKCHVGFDTKSMNYTIEYTRTDLAQAAVASAYEAAAEMISEYPHFMLMTPDQKKVCVHLAQVIRALAAPDQIAALAAERAKLDKTVEALRYVADSHRGTCIDTNGVVAKARAVLAEIGGV